MLTPINSNNCTHRFYQTSQAEITNTNTKTDKEKSSIDTSNDGSTCFNIISYPFVKIKEMLSTLFNWIFDRCCSCLKSKTQQEIDTVNNLLDLYETFKSSNEKEKKEINKQFKSELKNLDQKALKFSINIALSIINLKIIDETPLHSETMQELTNENNLENEAEEALNGDISAVLILSLETYKKALSEKQE